MAVHVRGPVWKSARATGSLPGVLPPVFDKGEMLVDGGLLNNLPTDVMRQRADVGTVMATDVSGAGDEDTFEAILDETQFSGWRVLARRLNPFAQSIKVPTMAEIMMRIVTISNKQAVKTTRNLADFYLRPSVGRYSMMEVEAIDEIVEQGYQSTLEILESWQDDEDFQALIQT